MNMAIAIIARSRGIPKGNCAPSLSKCHQLAEEVWRPLRTMHGDVPCVFNPPPTNSRNKNAQFDLIVYLSQGWYCKVGILYDSVQMIEKYGFLQCVKLMFEHYDSSWVIWPSDYIRLSYPTYLSRIRQDSFNLFPLGLNHWPLDIYHRWKFQMNPLQWMKSSSASVNILIEPMIFSEQLLILSFPPRRGGNAIQRIDMVGRDWGT